MLPLYVKIDFVQVAKYIPYACTRVHDYGITQTYHYHFTIVSH